MRRFKDVEQQILAMSGYDLLETLVRHAAMQLDARRNDAEAHAEVLVRAIQVRLAETGIAQKRHDEVLCRFMLGDDRCPCSCGHWSWPREGLPGTI